MECVQQVPPGALHGIQFPPAADDDAGFENRFAVLTQDFAFGQQEVARLRGKPRELIGRHALQGFETAEYFGHNVNHNQRRATWRKAKITDGDSQ